MNIVLAIILFIHGFAHLVGFVVPWKIANLKEMPYKTTLLNGKIDVGDFGIRLVGIIWLVIAVVFFICGVGLLLHSSWWQWLTIIVSVFSFFLCVSGLPDARIGIFVNILIVIFIFIAKRFEWLL
jgi:hypothetical protein